MRVQGNDKYLRLIALNNLNVTPDKNITRPTRIPWNRWDNASLRTDDDGQLFIEDGIEYAVFPGDIAYEHHSYFGDSDSTDEESEEYVPSNARYEDDTLVL